MRRTRRLDFPPHHPGNSGRRVLLHVNERGRSAPGFCLDFQGHFRLSGRLLTQRELARLFGVKDEAIRKWRAAGLPMRRIGRTWRATEQEVRAWLERHRNDPEPTRAGSARGDAEPRAEAERRAAVAKADAAELELARRRGELVERDIVRREVFALARAERDAWTGWAARVAPTLAAELGVDHAALLVALEREVSAHLAELSAPEISL